MLFMRFIMLWRGITKAKYGQDPCNVGDGGVFAPKVQDNRITGKGL